MGHKRFGSVAWLALAVLLGGGGYSYWRANRAFETTDNAYLNAHVYHVGAEVTGQVSALHVVDGQRVEKGAFLLDIDPEPFLIAVQRAQVQLQRARFQGERSLALLAEAESLVRQSEAELGEARLNHQRVTTLVSKHLLSEQQADAAVTRLEIAEAALAAARAHVAAEKANLGGRGEQNEMIRDALAVLEHARYELRNCRIVAPASGQITKLTAQRGDLVSRNQTLFMIVDDADFWIDANFKEKQLTNIAVGADAEVRVDMYPDKRFRGKVDNISSGSTTAFSLLPSQNATGNWVKIEQRVPVKVRILGLDPQTPFHIGTSGTVRVKKKT